MINSCYIFVLSDVPESRPVFDPRGQLALPELHAPALPRTGRAPRGYQEAARAEDRRERVADAAHRYLNGNVTS